MDSRTTGIILNWNDTDIVRHSVRRMSREVPVIVVDNGSDDQTFRPYPNVEYLLLGYNRGNCVARNKAIDKVVTEFYFLLDGDILYVPGTIAMLENKIDDLPDAGCLGVHSNDSVRRWGHNGCPDEGMADLVAVCDDTPLSDYPMAWTQYGLFRNDGQRFSEVPPFNLPGHGYEDDWFYREMLERGKKSYYVSSPLYYHRAHSGKRSLEALGASTLEDERRYVFRGRFGC